MVDAVNDAFLALRQINTVDARDANLAGAAQDARCKQTQAKAKPALVLAVARSARQVSERRIFLKFSLFSIAYRGYPFRQFLKRRLYKDATTWLFE
jgi:hypothetical protein